MSHVTLQCFGIFRIFAIAMKIRKDRKTQITELQAMRIALLFGLTHEYKMCRRAGMSIPKALEEWDLLDWSRLKHSQAN